MENMMFNLQLFAQPGNVVNTTTGTVNSYTGTPATSADMSPEMKTYYGTEMLENAREKMVFSQLGDMQILPANHGKTVEWRKFETLPLADKLVEGVIPEGKKLKTIKIEATIEQYGLYVAVTDQFDLHAIDPVILHSTEEVGYSAGLTNEKLVRAVLQTNGNTLYAEELEDDDTVKSTPATRAALAAATGKAYVTPRMINKAVTILKKANAPTFGAGKYVAIIHPSVAEDLRESKGWIEAHQYDASAQIFSGEIGELHGVRFIESNLAPIVEQGGKAVYLTMFFGKGAFGVIDPEGAGMETIIKDKSVIGGPLEQFGTVGAKFSMGAAILYPERMVTLESMSSYSGLDSAN